MIEPEAATLGHKNKKKIMHGYKCHAAIDAETYIVLGFTMTPSTGSEREEFEKLVIEGDREVLADKGYPSQRIKDFLKRKKVKNSVMEKKPRGQEQTPRSEARNKAIGARRGPLEGTFGVLKNNPGFRRSRVRGLAKTKLGAGAAIAASNLARLVRMGHGMDGKTLPQPAWNPPS